MIASRRALQVLAIVAVVTAVVSIVRFDPIQTSKSPGRILIFNAVLDVAQPLGIQDAVLISESEIIAVGTLAQLEPQCLGCQRIDAQGRFLMPGFHDSHIHLTDAAQALTDFTFDRLTPAKLMDPNQPFQQSLKQYVATHPRKKWIVGSSWSYSAFKGTLPTKKDLDAVESERPIVLRDVRAHQMWLNSKALAMVGIDRRTPNPRGGTIIRDSTGEPTGILLEAACNPVQSALRLSVEEYKDLILKGQEKTLALGYTSLQGSAMSFATEELQAFQQLDQEGRLKQRFFLWGSLTAPDKIFEQLVALKKRQTSLQKFQLVALKGFVDGSLAGETAALTQPYRGTGYHGLIRIEPERLNALVLRANQAGFPVSLHAMGDRAVRLGLDAFALSERKLGKKFRNRIEHASLVNPADLGRFKDTDTIASVQPIFTYYRSRKSFPFFKSVGAERIPWLYAWKNLLDAGVMLTFGSDLHEADFSKADPLRILFCATERLFKNGRPFTPRQKIDPQNALLAATLNPAIALGFDNKIGKIAPGHKADLILLERDPRLSPSKSIEENPIHLRMIDGVVY